MGALTFTHSRISSFSGNSVEGVHIYSKFSKGVRLFTEFFEFNKNMGY